MQVAVELEQAGRTAGRRCACATTASASRRRSSSASSSASTAFRARSPRVKGTGLGLFIVRSVVARHGGKVFAESDGPGPRQHVHGAAAGRGISSAMSRILVVEDEQHLADGLRFNLEAEQHDVDVVDTGEAALARLTARCRARFDLVILDVMLPGIDGFAVVAELRRARPVRAGADADRARPPRRRAARLRSRRRRLPAEAVRAADPDRRASAACCGATSGSGAAAEPAAPGGRRLEPRSSFARRTIDFEQLEVRRGRQARCR